MKVKASFAPKVKEQNLARECAVGRMLIITIFINRY